MASNSQFQRVVARGPAAGLGNLFRKENHDWWGTRSWWLQAVTWTVLLNGLLAFMIVSEVLPTVPGGTAGLADPALSAKFTESAFVVFFILAGLELGIGVVILAQDEIIGDRGSGAAAWVLSKPVSRNSFVLAKFFGNLPGILAIMVLLQGAIGYGVIVAMGGAAVPVLPYLAALALLFLHLAFYLALTLVVGALWNARGAALAIPLAILFMPKFLPLAEEWLGQVMPWSLTSEIAPALVAGMLAPSYAPVVATVAWIVLFLAVAIWRVWREEP